MPINKFNNRFRIPTTRAQWWDYSKEAHYFITICTAHFSPLLGRIQNQQMFLSNIGSIVHEEWSESFDLRKELYCDEFIIMPNHIHAIVTIKSDSNEKVSDTASHGIAYRPPRSLSTFVGGFKATVTSRLISQKIATASIWHPRFHDHIIRDEKDYYRIKKYIIENPMNWGKDKNNKFRSP